MNEYPEIAIKIVQAGAPVIDSAWTVYKTDQVILIEMGLKSKYCEVGASCDNGVFIDPTEHSLYLDTSADPESSTWVEFPEAKGYSFFGSSSGRYTIQLTFFKREV